MIDRTAIMRGITGTAGMFPGARRLSKVRARKRSRCAGRREIFRQLECRNDVGAFADGTSTWTILSPNSRKYQNTVWVIEGNEDLAVRVYAARNGGRHPGKTSCDCGCGPDYRIDERVGTLAAATAIERNCKIAVMKDGSVRITNGTLRSDPTRWDFQTLEQFTVRKDVVVVGVEDIEPHEAAHPLPTATYPSMYSQDEQTVAWLFDAEM